MPDDKFDREVLSAQLYPTPKTREELQHDTDQRTARYIARRPRWTLFSTNLFISVIVVAFMSSSDILTGLVNLLGTMGGVFMSFLIGLVAVGVLLWQWQRTLVFFTCYGLRSGWYIAISVIVSLLACWLLSIWSLESILMTRWLLGLLHYLLLAVLGTVAVRLLVHKAV